MNAQDPSIGANRTLSEPRHEVMLAGCTSTPLANYLKALGILRLVSEQADPEARGYWRNDQFFLVSRLDAEPLKRFFLNTYRPTPVLAPWNGGSGFYSGDNQSGIQPIAACPHPRFQPLQDAIQTIRQILSRLGLESKPDGSAKTDLLAVLRRELSDAALDWLDAAILLTDENPKYPPLLGTGGNDGRLDFTNNFLQRLAALFDPENGEAFSASEALADQALFDSTVPDMDTAAIGQFAPARAGGPNQGTGFDANALINPWDFVLMLEGALLFASTATRRLGTNTSSALSYPFTVRPTGSGSGVSAFGDEGNARAELWAPLWGQPASLTELRTLLAEGRTTLGRRSAVDGLDFVRAISHLGVDRGIDGFQRYAFLMRSGKAYFATPLNRVRVERNPAADLVDELDRSGWLERFRRFARSHGANRVALLANRVESAIFSLSLAGEDSSPDIRRLLSLLGETQWVLGRSAKAKEPGKGGCPPTPWLSDGWIKQANDGSGEFAIAAALAGLHGRALSGDQSETTRAMPMRVHMAPESAGRFPAWDDQATRNVTWGNGSVEDNLIATLQRRLLTASRDDTALVDKPLASSRAASLAAIAAWLDNVLDSHRIAALLPGLMLARIPGGGATGASQSAPLPAAYRVLKPFFCTNRQLVRAGLLPEGNRLPLPQELVRRLAADDIHSALQRALPLLRVAQIDVTFHDLAADRMDGRRLLAALLVPIADYDLVHLLPTPVPKAAEETTAT